MRRESTPPGLTASLELVSRAQAGDGDARERLFTRYYPRVLRVVRARMGVRLRELEDPWDIVQNTFMAALGALERFEAREDAALIDWFRATPPPQEPFQLYPGVFIARPEHYWDYLRGDIAAGPNTALASACCA